MTADLVLGVHPFSHGFGWVAFEKPLAPLDWGVVEKRGEKNAQCLFAITQIVNRYQPDVLAMEAYEEPTATRVARIQKLCRSIESMASGRDIDVCIYSGLEIRHHLALATAVSRYDIARGVAEKIKALKVRLPKQREIWNSEHPNMALFNAAAVALARYAAEATA